MLPTREVNIRLRENPRRVSGVSPQRVFHDEFQRLRHRRQVDLFRVADGVIGRPRVLMLPVDFFARLVFQDVEYFGKQGDQSRHHDGLFETGQEIQEQLLRQKSRLSVLLLIVDGISADAAFLTLNRRQPENGQDAFKKLLRGFPEGEYGKEIWNELFNFNITKDSDGCSQKSINQ